MSELYEGREQSQVKHFILRRYLERFAHIIGMGRSEAIMYVDGFSGPWRAQSQDYEDTSFGIALNELRKARAHCSEHGRNLQLRCFFVEKERSAYDRLNAFASTVSDVDVRTKHATLSSAVPDILAFDTASIPKSFPFVFLDPKGWTGLELDAITPLIRLNPGEVLVNFMTDFIRRFIEVPEPTHQESFERMFGPFMPPMEELRNLEAEDLDDVLVESYAELLRKTGRFEYVCKAVILRPEIDRTHYHLLYATRHPKGVEVFKMAEAGGMDLQQETRADAKSRRRTRKGQLDLFAPKVMDNPHYYESLRNRYREKARRKIVKLLRAARNVPFDAVWFAALSEPTVQQVDLDEWIHGWRERGQVVVSGMRDRQRVCRRGQGLTLSGSPELS